MDTLPLRLQQDTRKKVVVPTCLLLLKTNFYLLCPDYFHVKPNASLNCAYERILKDTYRIWMVSLVDAHFDVFSAAIWCKKLSGTRYKRVICFLKHFQNEIYFFVQKKELNENLYVLAYGSVARHSRWTLSNRGRTRNSFLSFPLNEYEDAVAATNGWQRPADTHHKQICKNFVVSI